MKCKDALIKNIAWHSLCDASELNGIILVWMDIAVSLKWLTKREPGSYVAQYNSGLCLPGSSFFTFEQRWSECANKILWNQTKFFFFLFWFSTVQLKEGMFQQWGLAGCESLLHLQDSIAVFTWTLKIFTFPDHKLILNPVCSMSDKLLLRNLNTLDILPRILMHVNIKFNFDFNSMSKLIV